METDAGLELALRNTYRGCVYSLADEAHAGISVPGVPRYVQPSVVYTDS
jgi:hypothetical protein